MFFDFSSQLCLKHFSFEEESSEIQIYMCVHVTYLLFWSHLIKFQDF